MRVLKQTTLSKAYPDGILGDGVFADLLALFADAGEGDPQPPDWLDEELDIEFFGNHSGDKATSTLLDHLLARNTDPDDEELGADERATIAGMVWRKFADKWSRLYDLLVSTEYNPIENYDMTETETPNLSRKHSVSDGFKETITRAADQDVTESTTGTAESDIFAFNSSTPVPSGTGENEQTIHRTGAAEDNTETEERTQIGYREDTETGTRTLTRAGNIGVMTVQQMATQEIELRKHSFYDIVFDDVDTILASPKYYL